jgi:hypothetical protein
MTIVNLLVLNVARPLMIERRRGPDEAAARPALTASQTSSACSVALSLLFQHPYLLSFFIVKCSKKGVQRELVPLGAKENKERGKVLHNPYRCVFPLSSPLLTVPFTLPLPKANVTSLYLTASYCIEERREIQRRREE